MRAMVIAEFGGPECMGLQTVPDPTPSEDQVLIDIKAFGVNRAELYFRAGLWGHDVARISGIECVGRVISDPTGGFAQGQKVIALMGGMGRTINGSYAQKVAVPVTNVVAVETDLSWQDLAAIPETYATAWACLHSNLSVAAGQTLLVRGATSALGQAAINIAVNADIKVIGTTRNKTHFDRIAGLGAIPMLDQSDLSQHMQETYGGLDAALDIVGNTTLIDTLACMRFGGKVCIAGFLGGGDPVTDFNPLMQMPSGVQLSFFGSAFVFGTDHYPLTNIPFQDIINDVANGCYQAAPDQVFQLDQLADAHRLMEANGAKGKLVVRVA